MSFSWLTFCQERGIEYRERGPSSKRGNIYIHCPFCGPTSSGMLMGLDVERQRWACWRDETHRGGSAVFLVQQLLQCSKKEALQIVGVTETNPDEWDQMTAKLGDKPADQEATFSWPEGVFKLRDDTKSARFLRYLRDERGYKRPLEVAKKYNLRGALSGDLAFRLVFPLQDCTGKVLGYSGRAIGTSSVRWLSSGGEVFTSLVFNARGALCGGKVLTGVEGPPDAMALDYYGSKHGVRAVALLGTSMPPERFGAVASLCQGFGGLAVSLDRGEENRAARLAQRLSVLGAQAVPVPRGYKDLGETPGSVLRQFAKKLSKLGGDCSALASRPRRRRGTSTSA